MLRISSTILPWMVGRTCRSDAPIVEQYLMPRWKNVSEPGEWVFLTTTILGWVPVFQDPRVADTMAAAIIDDCRHEGALLHAFVVMPEHIHAIISLPLTLDASKAMNRLKGAWGNRIIDCVSIKDYQLLAKKKSQSGERSVWMRSFVGKTIDNEFFFLQKADYIHDNPVRRGLCENTLEYVWSSAWHWDHGLRCDDGLMLDDDEIGKRWPLAVRDPLADVVKRAMRRVSEER
jgi:putative transposase